MALSNFYTAIQNGAITLIGNAICVNRDVNNWSPYVYMSTLPASQAPGYLGNTTTSATNAFSSATLNIPTTCTVKFARLFWYNQGNVPNIKMYLPDGTLQSLTADTNVNDGTFYCQIKDVTTLINTHKSGLYTVGNVTGTAGFPGWAMVVAYADNSLPFRYFNIYMGLASVGNGSPSPLTFSNFITPSSGPCKGYLLFAYGRGDLADGASFLVGSTIANTIIGNASTTVWNGLQPYNKSSNMFPGLICFADCNNPSKIGLIDTDSTLATRNINPYAGTYSASGRALFDVTGLDISNTLLNGQTNLYTKISFLGAGSADALLQAVQIDMNSASITPLKSVDKTIAYPNDTLTYTMVLNNNGLLDALNVYVVDTIPTGTSFVTGSLKVDGVTVVGSPILPGYSVGTIPYGTTTTVTFKVTVTTIPAIPTPLINSYSMSYKFIPITTPQTSSSQSNTVTTTVAAASFLNVYKIANKAYADIGDYITYTTTIPNTGGVDAGDVIFTDTIPLGTSYIANSFVLNSTSIPSVNPQAGVNIGTVSAGSTSTVSFMVQVTTIPTVNPIPNSGIISFKSYGVTPMTYLSNTIYTKVNTARLSLTKTTSSNYADVGTTITYTILVNNSGNTSATNVVFMDTIPAGTTFVNGSFSINNATISGSPNPSGINIGTIPVGITTVSFKVTVDTIATINPISNTATTTFNYTIDPSTPNGGSGNANSNTVSTQINNSKLILNKSVDKSYATCSDTLKYTIRITNAGNVSAANIVFKDTLPNGTQFISNSFTLDGVTISGADPSIGVSISTISAGATSTVTFKVLVVC